MARSKPPTIETRRDVPRPFYFFRNREPVATPTGVQKRRKRRFLGFCDEVSMDDATELMKELLHQLKITTEAQQLILKQQPPKQSPIKLADFVEQYFIPKSVPLLGAAARARYPSQLRNHIVRKLGQYNLDEVDKVIFKNFLLTEEKLHGGLLSYWARNDLRGITSAVYTAAMDMKLYTGPNPTKGIRLDKRYVREKRIIEPAEFRKVYSGVSERARFSIDLTLGLGLRVSELLGLQPWDADYSSGTLSIRRRWYRGDLAVPKTGNSFRTLELGPLVEDFKRRWPDPRAFKFFIFSDDGGVTPLDDRKFFDDELLPILKTLGLFYPGYGWRCFRRNNVTWRQLYGEASAIEAMKAAGHGSVNMTMLYTMQSPKRERQQVQSILDELKGTGNGKRKRTRKVIQQLLEALAEIEEESEDDV